MIIEVLRNATFCDDNSLPKQGTKKSTGYDLYATSDPKIVGQESGNGYDRVDYIEYETNLFLAPQRNINILSFSDLNGREIDTLVFPRSSVSKYNLILANSIGLIDTDYRNQILVRFVYQWQPEDLLVHQSGPMSRLKVIGEVNNDKIYKKGDKICQLKLSEIIRAKFELVDSLNDTDRIGGFGSTDNK